MTPSRRPRHFGHPLIASGIVREDDGRYTAWKADGSIVECATIEAAVAAVGGRRCRRRPAFFHRKRPRNSPPRCRPGRRMPGAGFASSPSRKWTPNHE